MIYSIYLNKSLNPQLASGILLSDRTADFAYIEKIQARTGKKAERVGADMARMAGDRTREDKEVWVCL